MARLTRAVRLCTRESETSRGLPGFGSRCKQAWDIQGGGEYSTFSVRALLDQPKTDLPAGFPQLKEISFKMSIINLSNSLPLSGQPYANMLWKRCSPVSIYLKSINSLTIVSILPVLRNWCLNLLFSCQ